MAAPVIAPVSGGGKLIVPIGPGDDYGIDSAIQADGKIVIAGYSHNGSNYDFSIIRLNANNGLDMSFGAGGKVIVPIGSGDDYGRSVTIQADGAILVAGYSFNGSNTDFSIIRLDASGALDPGFGVGGKVIMPVGSNDDYGLSVTLQADGKILIAGSSYNGIPNDFSIVRLNTNGTLDTAFGVGGKAIVPVGPYYDWGSTVTVQADGKILVGGTSSGSTSNEFSIIRLNANGTLDASFGAGGKAIIPVGSGYDEGLSITIQTDGKILFAGYSYNGSNFDFSVIRLNTDGTLDASFGVGGKAIIPVGTLDDQGQSVTLQADGKILVAGCSNNGTDYDFSVIRLNSDGSLDTGFGSGGKTIVPVGSAGDVGYSVSVQSDGKIIIAGASQNGSNVDYGVIRLNSDGSLDPGFNGFTPILWQNSQSGDVVGWSIQDNAFKSWGFVSSTGSNSPWRIEAQGNFDSTPGVDIVWKNINDGSVYIWNTANNAFVGGGYVSAVPPAAGWEIVASGYFNNDPYSDLLWQNSITNDIYIWNIQNNAFTGASWIGNPGVNSGWQAKAVGEFDGKGNSDILWQNKSSGDVYIWNVTNNQVSDQRFVGSVGANTGWEIKDVGNFNNDNYSDILWQNSITGDVYIWDIVNNAISGVSYVSSVGANSGWQIQNAGLYNADNFSDILWHNSVTGDAYVWNITNNALSGTASLSSAPTQWSIAPVNSPIT